MLTRPIHIIPSRIRCISLHLSLLTISLIGFAHVIACIPPLITTQKESSRQLLVSVADEQSLKTAMLALMRKQKDSSISQDSVSVVGHFAVGLKSLIERNTVIHKDSVVSWISVNLRGKLDPHMLTLFGCDFSNSLQEITRANFECTDIKILNLAGNELTNIAHIHLPLNMQSLWLNNNNIESLMDFTFDKCGWLHLSACEIGTIENVKFNSRFVHLSRNPIERMKNVTLINLKCLTMSFCDITLDKLSDFELAMNFATDEKAGECEWDLRNNPITLHELTDNLFQTPEGVDKIILDDGQYSAQTLREDAQWTF